MTKQFLRTAYDLENQHQTHALYKDWADSYDAEVGENGYSSPQRAALALANCCDGQSQPLLDIGCGTGVSGQVFQAAGFDTLVGSDFSQDMLDKAATKNVYTALHLADLNAPFDFVDTPFALMAAIGVLVWRKVEVFHCA